MLPSDTTELLLRSRLVGDIDVLEDVCLGELVLLALRRLGLIRTQGRDVDQSGNTGVHAGVRDDGSPVGVADKNDRTADSPECADGRVDIAFERVQAVLRSHHLVTLRPQRRDQLLETGTIGPDAVGEDNARFVLLGHCYLLE